MRTLFHDPTSPSTMCTYFMDAPKDAIQPLSHLFLAAAAATPINDVLNLKESDLLSPRPHAGDCSGECFSFFEMVSGQNHPYLETLIGEY